ncbi:MAG: cobalt ECF transporter T component CbiQ [Desulfobacterales bacterium]
MMEEPFAAGDSLIHRIDPVCRVAFATLLSFVIALSENFPALWAGLFFSLFLLFMARLNLKEVTIRMAAMWGFLLFLWILLPFTFEGEALYRVWKLSLTREGFLLAARISLKSTAILAVFISLVTTMNFTTLGYALNSLKIPEKLVHLLLLTYRYIFVIEQEYRRLLRAAKIRNFNPKTDIHTYRTYAYFVGMLFVRASARADRVYQAMRCRGFKGKFYCLREFSFSRADWIWTGLLSGAVAGLIFLEYWHKQ